MSSVACWTCTQSTEFVFAAISNQTLCTTVGGVDFLIVALLQASFLRQRLYWPVLYLLLTNSLHESGFLH